jgi:hypothetical protein
VFHEFGHYYARWLLSIIQAHAALMENVQNTYQSDILGTAMYNTTGLKHSETDVVSLCGSTRTAAAKKFREALQGIDPQDNLAIARSVDDFTEDFEEANKEQDTGLVIYWVHQTLLWLTSLILV